jgi:hypothetical protein
MGGGQLEAVIAGLEHRGLAQAQVLWWPGRLQVCITTCRAGPGTCPARPTGPLCSAGGVDSPWRDR